MSPPVQDVTRLLQRWSEGDPQALEQLMPLVMDELLRIAKRYFRRESPGHTLEPTALVNEVYLKLVKQKETHWESRGQFFAFAAELVRRILVDHARGRGTIKRGKGAPRVTFSEDLGLAVEPEEDILALDQALQKLAEMDPRQARIVEMRFFAGLTNDEIAEVLRVSATTVKREWKSARLWLFQEMRRGSE